MRFLHADASHDQLLRAVAANHRWWMIRRARAAGGTVHRAGDLTWVWQPGSAGEVTIPFPYLSRGTASARLDAILNACRQIEGLGAVSCWSLLERPRPPDLGSRLAARGFSWGWQPLWMWLDLGRLDKESSAPNDIHIELVDGMPDWDVDDLPNYDRAAAVGRYALARQRPRRVWHWAAWQDGQVVGHSTLHQTVGRLGVAGIYDVGVVPAARRQGVGRAVTLAALQFARALGCRHALLNATPKGASLYHRLGFESLGHGQTWWLHQPILADGPPPASDIQFLEAVGGGNLDRLSMLGGQLDADLLDTGRPCGMTPVQLAVKMRQTRAVEWLVAHGATLDIISAWDLGWKDRAISLLTAAPELVNTLAGGCPRRAPLHEAAARGDTELARLLLTANADLTLRDADFGGTPLDWARHFERPEIIRLIEQREFPTSPMLS